MYPTSAQWQQNQRNPVTTEGFVELSFYFTDPNIHVREVRPRNELDSVSQSYQIINKHPKPVAPFATLEPDLWLLDGSRITVPESFPQPRPFGGFISNVLCNDNGVFETPVYLDIVLLVPAVILPGITVVWGTAFDEYPEDFSVIMLNENSQETGRMNITGNKSVTYEVNFSMRRVHKIRLQISRWCRGNRRARVGNIFLGHKRVYTKDSLLAFSGSHEIDPVSARLPKYEISFEIDNRNGDFDPLESDRVYQFALERQEVVARYGFRRLSDSTVEWIPGGQYFLTDWTAPRNGLSASFKARDLLGSLSSIYYKGVYQGYELVPLPIEGGIQPLDDDGGEIGEAPQEIRILSISLYQLAENVLLDANFPYLNNLDDCEREFILGEINKKWEIDESLKEITTISPLPIATHAECLQLIANAAGAALTFDREGVLHIAPLHSFNEGRISYNLDDDNTYSRPEAELQRPLKSVQVSTYTWRPDRETDTELYNQELTLDVGVNEFFVEFSNPAVDVQVSLSYPYLSRHENIYEAFSQSARLVIHRRSGDTSQCRVTIRGRVIRPSESTVVVMDNTNINNDRSDRGETLPLKNILITNVAHARTVANRLLARYRNRKNVSVGWRIDPSLDMGDFIALEGSELQSEQSREIMQTLSTDFRFNGAFTGKSEGVVI